MFEMPENSEIEGLEGDAVNNFRKLSDVLDDAEEDLKKMKTAEEVRKIFRINKK
jgi:hypothetical protein